MFFAVFKQNINRAADESLELVLSINNLSITNMDCFVHGCCSDGVGFEAAHFPASSFALCSAVMKLSTSL